MALEDLQKYPLIYLATPYSKYPQGIEVAFRHAAALAARLLQRGLRVYSPITHTHPIAIHGGADPLDLSIWLPFDAAIMAKADAILVAQMEGWEISTGIRHEIDVFGQAGKPIYYLDPAAMELVDA